MMFGRETTRRGYFGSASLGIVLVAMGGKGEEAVENKMDLLRALIPYKRYENRLIFFYSNLLKYWFLSST